MATPNETARKIAGLCLRAVVPCAILVGGWYGFSKLSQEVEDKPTAKAEERVLRTRVENLQVVDYTVEIETQGVVQAHNRVTLAAEISGVISRVSPSFEAGAYFSEGEVLVEIDPRNYATAVSMAESRLLAAESALKLAKLNEERQLRLIKSNAVPQADVDAASANREQAEADVDLARSQLEQAKFDLERTKVVAPFDGRVHVKNIGIGQLASPNAPLGEIFAVEFAEVRLPISGRQRQFLNLPEFAGDPQIDVVLRDSINETSDAVWHAKIVRTEGALDEDSRNLFAIAQIDDPFGRETGYLPLRIGQPVVASIKGEVLRNVITLPRDAVRELDRVILVDRKDQTLRPLNIQAIWSDARYVVVEATAIPNGMWIATTPMVFTPEGSRVEIISEPTPATSIADSKSVDSSGSAAQ